MFEWTTFGFDRVADRFAAFEPRTLTRGLDTEALATLREAMLAPLDLAPVVPAAKEGEDVVVLIHGFLASAGVFRPMRARLEAAGVHVASFTHPPGFGVRRIARQLSSLMHRLHPGARVHLVGHSLGGVVARWYVQEECTAAGEPRPTKAHPGVRAPRVLQTISLGSPFGGVRVAERLPLFVGAELHGESKVLARVRAGARSKACEVPHTSLIAGDDRLVFPAANARLPRGEAVVLPGLGHNMLLFDQDVFDLIVQCLRSRRAAA